MKRFILGSVVAAAISGTVPASATTYSFSGGGFTDGATFSGSFDAEDIDGNGLIDSFAGEVTAFSATFSGNSVFPPTSFGFATLFSGATTGLVWDMDALLGDGADDYLHVRQPGNADFAVAQSGPCDGVGVCARIASAVEGDISDTSLLPLRVALPAAVPEPASWALMIGGFALAGGVLRRRPRPAFGQDAPRPA